MKINSKINMKIKSISPIIFALTTLCGCISEDVTAPPLSSGIDTILSRMSRSVEESDTTRYPFINLMVGEDLDSSIVRKNFLQSDGEYLLNRTDQQNEENLYRLKSMYNEESIHNTLKQYYLIHGNLYSLFEARRARQAFISYAHGEMTAIELSHTISPKGNQVHHFWETVRFIDNVAKPFGEYALKKSFDSAASPEDCYDAAIEAVVDLGLDFAIGAVLTSGISLSMSAYTAYKLYRIYVNYDDCLERVNNIQ